MRSFWSLLGEVYLQKISHRPSVVGKWNVEHLDSRELFQNRSRRQSRSSEAQFVTQSCVETKGQERTKNMGFDSLLELVKDRSHSEITFEIFERFLDLGEQDIKLPELSGIFTAQVGAKQVAAFPLTNLAQFILAQAKGKFSVLADLYFDQAPARWILALGCPQLEQQCIASWRHLLEFFKPSPEFFELAPAHRAFFSYPIVAASQDIKLAFPR